VEVDLLGGHGTGTRVAIGRRLGLIVVCLAIASVAAAEPPASR